MLVARIWNEKHRPLKASGDYSDYQDAAGSVVASSIQEPLADGTIDLSTVQIWLPYFALNLPDTDGQKTHNLLVFTEVYVDGKLLAGSETVPFSVKW